MRWDHGIPWSLDSTRPKVTRDQIGGYRHQSCRKMPADDSVFTEMAVELWITQQAICRGAPSCINTVVVLHHLV
ncbi:hypothetical protein TNCV_1052511 [Trichonephila clavipes]|nr:hypothetical protein TNCV_1052511 [Trichonephila clavipes]